MLDGVATSTNSLSHKPLSQELASCYSPGLSYLTLSVILLNKLEISNKKI